MYIQNSQKQRVILASRSASRRAILEGAGIAFEAHPADLDETTMLVELERAGASIEERAAALAQAKAEAVAERLGDPELIVIGSDQILDFDGAALETPETREAAAERLRILSGRRHDLVCGLAVLHKKRVVLKTTERVAVHMRAYSETELETYLAIAPKSAFRTVGCYELEGLGARLLDRLEGDWFSALGMPLFPMLAALRRIADEEAGHGPASEGK